MLKIVEMLPVEFYLTGGTTLSRVYLNHRYSDDLDFFVNDVIDFKIQVNTVIKAFAGAGLTIETAVADEGFARIFVLEDGSSLKIDFVNDVHFRSGATGVTQLFERTDNLLNILSNKLTALGRYAPKDVVDIVYICESVAFNWENILNDASEKDLWVNPINVAEVLEQFPIEKLQQIIWIIAPPSNEWFTERINLIISEILEGRDNSLFK